MSHNFSYNLFLVGVINEMVMHEEFVVENINEKGCVGDEATCHAGIWEVSVAHGVVVYIEGLVDKELIFFNRIFTSRFFAKSPHSKFTIIIVANGISSSFRILFYLFAFDTLILLAANHLLKCEITRIKVIHFDPVLCIIFFGYSDSPC